MPKCFGTVKGRIYRAQQTAVEPEAKTIGKESSASYLRRKRKEKEAERKQERLKALLSDPNHPRHGGRAAYQDGCHCDRCKEANREYSANRAKA